MLNKLNMRSTTATYFFLDIPVQGQVACLLDVYLDDLLIWYWNDRVSLHVDRSTERPVISYLYLGLWE